MQTNKAIKSTLKTHEGAPAVRITAMQQLRRSVLSCLLWEGEFYEDGVGIAARIRALAEQVKVDELAALAVEARVQGKLRHAPLLLLVALAHVGRGKPIVQDTIAETIRRPDELTEFLSLYWQGGKRPLSAQVKKGLARALAKFSAYALAKYNRDGAIKLRDVLFLVHAKPKDDAQAQVWKQLVDGTLAAPDTWEVALSGGADKRATFERLIRDGKLGYLALLRNLRNMAEAGCDLQLVRDAIVARGNGADMVLPFRYVAAARACPQLEPQLDIALQAAIAELPAFDGPTAVLVDVSGSMNTKLSGKSDLTRLDAAAALASIIPGQVRVFSFSEGVKEVPPRKGMAGIDAIVRSQPHQGTYLGKALANVEDRAKECQRLIVITDEQSHDAVRGPGRFGPAYLINVASNKNGVGYHNGWTHIDGFSENVIRYIVEVESST